MITKKTRLITVLSIIVLSVCFFASLAYADDTCEGFRLPRKAEKVEANRYLLPMSWDQTLKFYRRAYAGNPRVKKTTAAALPGVNAVHFENLYAKTGSWEGANVSRIKGKVYVFCYVKEEKKK